MFWRGSVDHAALLAHTKLRKNAVEQLLVQLLAGLPTEHSESLTKFK